MNFSKLNPEVVGQLMMEALADNDPLTFFKNIISDPANNIYFPQSYYTQVFQSVVIDSK